MNAPRKGSGACLAGAERLVAAAGAVVAGAAVVVAGGDVVVAGAAVVVAGGDVVVAGAAVVVAGVGNSATWVDPQAIASISSGTSAVPNLRCPIARRVAHPVRA
jgi:hypothetical protein